MLICWLNGNYESKSDSDNLPGEWIPTTICIMIN